jgi:hypothetical protein
MLVRFKWRGGVAKVEYDRRAVAECTGSEGSHRSRSQSRMSRPAHAGTPEEAAARCGDGGREVRIEVKQFT